MRMVVQWLALPTLPVAQLPQSGFLQIYVISEIDVISYKMLMKDKDARF